jgi:homoserine kinase
VAGAAAVNALLGTPLHHPAILAAAVVAEEQVAGRHLDNIAPSLLGGFVLIQSLDPIDVLRLPVPDGIHVVLAHPDQRLRTAEARAVLPAQVSRATALHQMAHVAMMVAALYEGDVRRFGRAIDDRIAEPARAPLLKGFAEAKSAALDAGAVGASISGAGPTSFAICDDASTAERVVVAMREAYAASGVVANMRVAQIDTEGTRVHVTTNRSE